MSDENPYDVVIDTLQKQRDSLWKMTERNMRSEYIGFNIMDQIRLKHIDQLDNAMLCWKKYKHEWRVMMNNDEWYEKYTKMSIFYQDRLKYTEDMLAKAMEMNLKLVGMLQDSRADHKFGPGFSDPLKHVMPFDGRAAGQKAYDGSCVVCGLKGMNGYVCPNTACPSRVTCNASTSI